MPERNAVATLLELETQVRGARSRAALLLTVTRTADLVAVSQVALLLPRRRNRWRVAALSNVPEVDRTAPFVQWLERLARDAAPSGSETTGQAMTAADAPDRLRDDWSDLCPAQAYWLPLVDPVDGLQGVLFLARSDPWSDDHTVLLSHLAGAYAQALALWRQRRGIRLHWGGLARRWLGLSVLALVVAAQFLPVPMTALAPAEVVASEPEIVSAPMDGVIAEVLVRSNAAVGPGDPLVRMETTELQSAFEVAQQELAVARAELREARQGGLADARVRGRLERLEAEVALQEARLAFSDRRLRQALVVARRAGVALVEQRDEMAGRPVQTGQELLRVADPERIALEIRLPVADAMVLEPGAPVALFLDADPLQEVNARIERSDYRPTLADDGTLTYRVTARFEAVETPLRIGLRGTARVEGPSVRLFYYLFRRPLTAARQWLGW